MKQVTTYVGIDAHKKDLFVAMLIGAVPTPATWQLANEPGAVRRLVRKREREAPGPVHVFYEAGPVRLRAAAADDDGPHRVRRHGARLEAEEARRARQDESPRCAEAGRARARRTPDGGAAADTGRRGGPGSGAGA